jgi:hypothetical protein
MPLPAAQDFPYDQLSSCSQACVEVRGEGGANHAGTLALAELELAHLHAPCVYSVEVLSCLLREIAVNCL